MMVPFRRVPIFVRLRPRVSLVRHLFVSVVLLLSPMYADAAPSRPTQVHLLRAWPTSNKVFVATRINGTNRGVFLVDTGADTTILQRAFAARIGLKLEGKTVELNGLDATAEVRHGILNSLAIGDRSVTELHVGVGLPGLPPTIASMPIDGILGNDVLQQFSVELDFKANTMILRDPDALPIGDYSSLLFDGAHPTVPLTIDINDHHVRLLITLDTGATGLLLRGPDTLPDAVGSGTVGLEPVPGLGRPTGSGRLSSTKRFSGTLRSMGGAALNHPIEVTWSDYDNPEALRRLPIRGLVGQQVMQGRRLRFDYGSGWVQLSPSPRITRFYDGRRDALIHDLRQYGRTNLNRTLFRAPLYVALGRTGVATQLLEDTVDANRRDAHHDPTSHVMLARLQRMTGDHHRAIEVMAGLSMDDRVTTGIHHELVMMTARQGAREQATAMAEHAVAHFGNRWDTHLALFDIMERVDPVRASEALHRARDLGAPRIPILLGEARLAGRIGDNEGRLSALRRLMDHDRTYGAAYWFYTQFAEAEDLPLAALDVERALHDVHLDHQPLDFLAGALATMGRMEDAIRVADSGRQRDCDRARSTHKEQRYCHIWYDAMLGRYRSSDLAFLRRSLSLGEPELPSQLDTLAMVAELAGRHEEAHHARARALALAPTDAYLAMQTHLHQHSHSDGLHP